VPEGGALAFPLGGEHQPLDPPVVRVGPAFHQAAVFEPVD
jgi:hypothetical protein